MPFCAWDRTAPSPTVEASVVNINGILKSGNANTGVLLNLLFNLSNDSWHSWFQSHIFPSWLAVLVVWQCPQSEGPVFGK